MEKGKAGRVFISYQRQETAWAAGRLYDVLVEHFPAEQVFKDIDNIESGEDFVEHITAAVGSSDALLVVIGPDWLTITDKDGQRRLDNPDDHVRLEIETALQRKIQVIPILVDEARMPRADELPPSLAPLVRRNAVEINPLTFDTKRLITAVQRTLATAELVDGPASAAVRYPAVQQPQMEGADPRYDQGAHYKRGDLICGVCGTSNPPGAEFCTNCNNYLAWDRSGVPRPAGQPPTPYPGPTPDALVDENVQFTVYRPNAVQPEVWYPLLAFAHLAERRADAPPTQPDPLEQVRALAEQALGDNAAYGAPRVDARGGVPREGQLTFAPSVEGVDFNPRTQTFEWQEDVHQQSFRLKARSYAAGLVLRGQLTVYLGAVILADIDLTFRVDIAAPPPPTPSVHPVTLLPAGSPPPTSPQPELTLATANPYDKIFVSYSHKDLDIVRQFEAYGKTLGNDYLRDQLALRSGDEWDVRLLQLIDEANIFQLFWSSNSMRSKYVRREWEHALALGRPAFIRPTYWEVPMPHSDNPRLPPDELAKLHFHGFFEGLDGRLDGAWPPPPSPPSAAQNEKRPQQQGAMAPEPPTSAVTEQAASGSSMRRPWLIGCAVIIFAVLAALLVVFLVRG